MPTEEKRKLKRWHLVYYLRLFDTEHEAQMGHVINLTTEGIKVVSQWPVPTGKELQLAMDVPRQSGGSRRLTFKAKCLWSHKDPDNPSFHNSGLRLVEADPETAAAIRKLIDQLED